jgi:hypothetical protein
MWRGGHLGHLGILGPSAVCKGPPSAGPSSAPPLGSPGRHLRRAEQLRLQRTLPTAAMIAVAGVARVAARAAVGGVGVEIGAPVTALVLSRRALADAGHADRSPGRHHSPLESRSPARRRPRRIAPLPEGATGRRRRSSHFAATPGTLSALLPKSGDRGRTGDLVLGTPIDSGHHTISAHRRPGKLRVSPRSTTHGLGSIAAQSGTHLVHTVRTRPNTVTPFTGSPRTRAIRRLHR